MDELRARASTASLVRTIRVRGKTFVDVDDLRHWLRRFIDRLPDAERALLNEALGKLDRAQ
jgi:hypothetical protein